jgi:hypothetical protein
MKKLIGLVACFFALNYATIAQTNTVGLLSYDAPLSYEGYNLIYPHNQSSVFLINSCGEIVHRWDDEANFRPGNTAYLTADGMLYKSKRDAAVAGDRIWAGGGGAILEIRDWDNNLIWDFEMNDSINRLHHDFSVTETGNIIAIAWELKNADECIAAGRDTSTLAQGEMWPDWVFEIDPFNDTIVWEWHAWDHLVQDFDDTKDNFGVIADNPGKIDVNYGREDGHPDWMHANALDYNIELKQVMLSVPYFDELWIIDKTTSTAQAATDFGGFGNKGGDLMFRWGNPVTYGAGTAEDRQLFFQHDTHWIDDHLGLGHPQYGKIAVFNNRVGSDYSTVNIISPTWDMYDWEYEVNLNGTFDPQQFEVTRTHPDTTALYSTGLSSVQILPNNNMLIMGGRFGYAFELTPDNYVVWEYKTPLRMGAQATQGDTLTVNNNLTFRMDRYPLDFPAFDGKDLSSKGWLELEPDTTFCDRLVGIDEILDESKFVISPNPASNKLSVEWYGMMKANIEIYTMDGVLVDKQEAVSGSRTFFDVSNWQKGIYLVSIRTDKKFYSRKLIIQRG